MYVITKIVNNKLLYLAREKFTVLKKHLAYVCIRL